MEAPVAADESDASVTDSPFRLGSPGPLGMDPPPLAEAVAAAPPPPPRPPSSRTLLLPSAVEPSEPPVRAAAHVCAGDGAREVPAASQAGDGFSIVELSMRDGATGARLWSARGLSAAALARGELEVRLPAATLRAAAVVRAVTFHSPALLRDLTMTQRVRLRGACIEEHFFRFGFCIPGSTNSWESVVEGAGAGAAAAATAAADAGADEDGGAPLPPLNAADISGHVQVETIFFDGGAEISRCTCRIFYD